MKLIEIVHKQWEKREYFVHEFYKTNIDREMEGVRET